MFFNDAPGFPNPQGSTTSSYPADSRPTLNMFVPFEQEGVIFNGAENTTIDRESHCSGWLDQFGLEGGKYSTAVGNRQVGSVVLEYRGIHILGSEMAPDHDTGPGPPSDAIVGKA